MAKTETPDVLVDAAGTNSIPATLLRIRQDMTESLIRLGKLVRLQETMQKVEAGNPYSIADLSVDDAATDGGYVKALHNASHCKEPFARIKAYLRMLKEIVGTITSLVARNAKLESRIGALGNTEAENVAASELKKRCNESVNALGRKRDYVLKMLLGARKTVLRSLVTLDGELRELWPDGSPELRKAILKANCSEEIQTLAMDEQMMKTSEGKRK